MTSKKSPLHKEIKKNERERERAREKEQVHSSHFRFIHTNVEVFLIASFHHVIHTYTRISGQSFGFEQAMSLI